jgi:hypothetical protein
MNFVVVFQLGVRLNSHYVFVIGETYSGFEYYFQGSLYLQRNYCLGVLLVVAIPALRRFVGLVVILLQVTCLLVDDQLWLALNNQSASCTLYLPPRTSSRTSVSQKCVVSQLNIGHQSPAPIFINAAPNFPLQCDTALHTAFSVDTSCRIVPSWQYPLLE